MTRRKPRHLNPDEEELWQRVAKTARRMDARRLETTIDKALREIRMATHPRRPLGNSDLKTSPIGLGCMDMSDFYGKADDAP